MSNDNYRSRRRRRSSGGRRKISVLIAGIVLIAAVAATVLIIGKLTDKGSEINSKGLLAYEEGNYEEALKLFNEALTHDEDNAGILLNKAQTLTALERYDEAVDCYNEALLNAGSGSLIEKAQRGKAYCYYALGDTENAEEYLKKVLEYGYCGDNALYGFLLYGKGDHTGAMEQFDIYLASAPEGDPHLRDVLFTRVCIYEDRLSWSDAKTAVDALLEKFPDDPEGLHEKTFIESRLN